jgi:hypothetical protein
MKIKKADITKQKQRRTSQTNFIVAGNTDGTDNWDTETDPLFTTAAPAHIEPVVPIASVDPAEQVIRMAYMQDI